MTFIKPLRPRRFFYADNVNMNWSFDRLHETATKLLGAELDVGDILICDNVNKTKRKMLQMTKKGFMIYYARLNEDHFEPLATSNGMLKGVPAGSLL